MKRLALLLLLLLPEATAVAQWTPEQLAYDSVRLMALPKLELKERLKTGKLPYRVDNSNSIYFPPIFTQYGYSCNQSSSIAYIYTYETCVLHHQPAYKAENRLSLFFPWNMLNSGLSNMGVSYFDSWDLVDAAGCPNVVDFGYGTGTGTEDHTVWISGYPKYLRAMQNRTDGVWSIDIGTETGLQTLKSWLYDHGGEREPGGLANFQISSGGQQWVALPEGTEDAGKMMITWFANTVGHAMTFVGYNDSVRYDFNGDGRYTNNFDLTGDGKITMLDWEKGALICVNSYGETYGTRGRAYIPYCLLPRFHTNGGIWMRSAVVTRVHKSYKPDLALRVRIDHPNRSKLWITAGVAQNPEASKPDHVLDIPLFRYQGGGYPMLGAGSGDRSNIEIGIDASPLLSFLEPGREAAFFLVINEKDPAETSEGRVDYFSFIDYTYGTEEHYADAYYIPLENGYQDFKVTFTPNHAPPAVSTTTLPLAAAGENYQATLTATGGTAPYKWLPLNRNFREEPCLDTFPTITETRMLPVVGNDEKVTVTLPFPFPFFEKSYTRMTIYTDGALVFESSNYSYPYAIDKRKLLSLNRAIYPWYNSDIELPHMQDWVYFKADSTCAIVRWNVSVSDGGHNYDVNFAAKLYPDGVVELFYGKIEMRPFFNWFVAVAGGSEDQFNFPEINFSGVANGKHIRLIPDDFPFGLSLSSEGILSGIPSTPGKTWTFPVWVEDYNKLRGTKELTLSTQSTQSTLSPSLAPSVRIFPNPISTEAWIEVRNARAGTLTLEIMDLTGKTVVRKNYEVREGEGLVRCSEVGKLPQGIYLYRVSGSAIGQGKIVNGSAALR